MIPTEDMVSHNRVLEDLKTKLTCVVDYLDEYMSQQGDDGLPHGIFSFPDGDYWPTSKTAIDIHSPYNALPKCGECGSQKDLYMDWKHNIRCKDHKTTAPFS